MIILVWQWVFILKFFSTVILIALQLKISWGQNWLIVSNGENFSNLCSLLCLKLSLCGIWGCLVTKLSAEVYWCTPVPFESRTHCNIYVNNKIFSLCKTTFFFILTIKARIIFNKELLIYSVGCWSVRSPCYCYKTVFLLTLSFPHNKLNWKFSVSKLILLISLLKLYVWVVIVLCAEAWVQIYAF